MCSQVFTQEKLRNFFINSFKITIFRRYNDETSILAKGLILIIVKRLWSHKLEKKSGLNRINLSIIHLAFHLLLSKYNINITL